VLKLFSAFYCDNYCDKKTGYVFFGFSYYRSNDAVKEDNELQAFVNELAINGSGPDGGNGKVMKLLQPL